MVRLKKMLAKYVRLHYTKNSIASIVSKVQMMKAKMGEHGRFKGFFLSMK